MNIILNLDQIIVLSDMWDCTNSGAKRDISFSQWLTFLADPGFPALEQAIETAREFRRLKLDFIEQILPNHPWMMEGWYYPTRDKNDEISWSGPFTTQDLAYRAYLRYITWYEGKLANE